MFKLLTITNDKITLSQPMTESAAVRAGEKWEEENGNLAWFVVPAGIKIVQE